MQYLQTNSTILNALSYCGVSPSIEILTALDKWFDNWDPCDCRDYDTAVWRSVVQFCCAHDLGQFNVVD